MQHWKSLEMLKCAGYCLCMKYSNITFYKGLLCVSRGKLGQLPAETGVIVVQVIFLPEDFCIKFEKVNSASRFELVGW